MCIWNHIYAWAHENDILLHELNENNIICNSLHESPGHVINFVVLLVKQHIYACKCKGQPPELLSISRKIKFQQNLEKYNCKCRNELRKHVAKWKSLYPALEEMIE